MLWTVLNKPGLALLSGFPPQLDSFPTDPFIFNLIVTLLWSYKLEGKQPKGAEGIRPVPHVLLKGVQCQPRIRPLESHKQELLKDVRKQTTDLLKLVKYSFILWCYRFTTPAFYFYFAQMKRVRKVAIYCLWTRQNFLINYQGERKRRGKWLLRILGKIFFYTGLKVWRSAGVPLHSESTTAREKATKALKPRESWQLEPRHPHKFSFVFSFHL